MHGRPSLLERDAFFFLFFLAFGLAKDIVQGEQQYYGMWLARAEIHTKVVSSALVVLHNIGIQTQSHFRLWVSQPSLAQYHCRMMASNNLPLSEVLASLESPFDSREIVNIQREWLFVKSYSK